MSQEAIELRMRLQGALEECQRLQEEIRQLKRQLALRDAAPAQEKPESGLPPAQDNTTQSALSPQERIELFRSLFRGREDVYAHRVQFKRDGKWGYVPHGEHDWAALRGVREEDWKSIDRQTRKLFPLTDDVVKRHLTGKMTVGLYPLLADETCWLLAADFDKKTWEEDSLAFVATCHQSGFSAYLERSRSGKGGHVWIFFERPRSAVLARKLGCTMLTRTMERRHQIGLDSYDRFFPSQDTLPKAGFGNLIALPLQWAPRQNGNSVFVDSNLRAYDDQWQLLASVKRVAADQAEWIVNDAARRNQVVGVRMALSEDAELTPWTLLPSKEPKSPRIPGPFP